MWLLVELFFVALLASVALWGIFLFCVSPYLMGDTSDLYAFLVRIFGREKYTQIIRVTLTEGQLALASALLAVPPSVTILGQRDGPIVAREFKEFTAASTTIEESRPL